MLPVAPRAKDLPRRPAKRAPLFCVVLLRMVGGATFVLVASGAPTLRTGLSHDRRCVLQAAPVDSRPLAPCDTAMARYAAGDEAAFAAVYDELAPRLYGYLVRQTRETARAEDLVQQTFLQMHRARGSVLAGAEVVPWAFAIARRLMIDGFRRGRREVLRRLQPPRRAGAAEGPPADDLVQAQELATRIRRELARLPETQRVAFELVKGEGLSLAEAAASAGDDGGGREAPRPPRLRGASAPSWGTPAERKGRRMTGQPPSDLRARILAQARSELSPTTRERRGRLAGCLRERARVGRACGGALGLRASGRRGAPRRRDRRRGSPRWRRRGWRGRAGGRCWGARAGRSAVAAFAPSAVLAPSRRQGWREGGLCHGDAGAARRVLLATTLAFAVAPFAASGLRAARLRPGPPARARRGDRRGRRRVGGRAHRRALRARDGRAPRARACPADRARGGDRRARRGGASSGIGPGGPGRPTPGRSSGETIRARGETIRARGETIRACRETLRARRETLRARRETLRARRETLGARGETLRARGETLRAPEVRPTEPAGSACAEKGSSPHRAGSPQSHATVRSIPQPEPRVGERPVAAEIQVPLEGAWAACGARSPPTRLQRLLALPAADDLAVLGASNVAIRN